MGYLETVMTKNVYPNLRRAIKIITGCNRPTLISSQVRKVSFLWRWVNWVFNTVDTERLKLVGPDCACAEWLLRNGASVKFKNYPSYVSEYNALIALEETPELPHLKIEEIFAKEADLSEVGFNHLKNCDHIKKITFIFCSYIDNKALFKLNYISKSLQYLEMKSCFNVDDEGVLSLVQLRNLKRLILADLVSVKNKDKCEAVLRKDLRQCEINFQK